MKPKALVIAEKQLAAETMAKVLHCMEEKDGYFEGEDYIVTWADGHLTGYMYPEEYRPAYKKWKLEDLPLDFSPEKSLKILPGKEKHFEKLKKLIEGPETDRIINAGDAGREGYLIQNRIYQMAGNRKPVKVLWASSMTDGALAEAFSSLHDEEEFRQILLEAEARSEMDYILGMNYSRLLSLKCSNDLTLPYGRCMTTLLNLIVLREKEIEAFVPGKTYALEAEMENGVKALMADPEGTGLTFETLSEAESIAGEFPDKEKTATVYEVKKKTIREKAPLLYSLPDLQSAIGRKYKYTPEKTLQIAQTLYEKRRILSYPRTDSSYLTTDMMLTVQKNLACCRFGKFKTALSGCMEGEGFVRAYYFNDAKVSDHHALIPADNRNMERIYQTLSREERNVFDEIVYRFLGIFAKERVCRSAEVTFTANGYLFRSSKSAETEPGYRLLSNPEPKQEELPPAYEKAGIGDKMKIRQLHILERHRNPPPRYHVGSITDLMRKYRIGTPATMAATIEKLTSGEHPFLALKDGKYYTTPFGRMYITVVPEPLKDPDLTRDMEYKLQQIREGSLGKEEMIQELYEELRENLNISDFKKMSFARAAKGKRPAKAGYRKKRRSYAE